MPCRRVEGRWRCYSLERPRAYVADYDLLNSDVRCGDRLEIDASEVLEVASGPVAERQHPRKSRRALDDISVVTVDNQGP